MTTQTTPRKTAAPPPAPTGAPHGTDKDTTLDRRRDKWQTTQQTLTAAQARIADLDKMLDANAAQRSEHEIALQAALDRQAELKTALKASAKEHDHLRASRKHADRDAGTALHRAQAAEAKYDKALLADMLRQQKTTDLSAHTGGTKSPAPRAANRLTDTPTPRRRSTPASRQPRTTETPTAARATARRTAASVTARKARS